MRCDDPLYVTTKTLERVPVPCGRCPPCKQRRVNSWVFRMMEEDKVSSSSHFVTLTYDTRFVPITEHGFMTLKKDHLQDYFKRLRKAVNGTRKQSDPLYVHIKYYAVGEYGGQTRRPHYHGIFFNVPDSELFAKAWSLDGQQFGIVHVGTETRADAMAYCTKYIDKPRYKKQFERDDRAPEFSVMSKGLGLSYVTQEIVDYHRADPNRFYVSKLGGYKIAMPRYYRNLIWSKEEQEQQVLHINAAVEKQEQQARALYAMRGLQLSYDEQRERAKAARLADFYSSMRQKRDKL